MRKTVLWALAAVAAAAVGCSASPGVPEAAADAPEVPTDGVTGSQVSAFTALQKDTGVKWSWTQHQAFKTPMHVHAERSGPPVLVRGASPQATTLAFLAQYRDLFKMSNPASELSPTRAEIDEQQMTHVRFQQVAHGLPVVGAEVMAHYDAEGHVASIDLNYVSGLDNLDLNPSVAPSEAIKLAKEDAIAQTGVEEAYVNASGEPKLVVFALNGKRALAYEHTVRVWGDDPHIWIITVDAKTGEVINRLDNLQTIEATGTGVAGDSKKFEVAQNGGTFTMLDTSRGAQIRTFTNQNTQNTLPGTTVSSTSLTTWDQVAVGRGAAVDAHFNATVVYDYYKQRHARNGLDGQNGAMVSTAHFGSSYDNAFWDGSQMAYGDGGRLFKPLSAALDVVAHEFTHGVTTNTSNLRYEGQSGALNESVSDIFGAFVEHFHKADETKNWLCGEAIGLNGALRNLAHPGQVTQGKQPAAMSQFVNTQQDNGGVHINSGIPNNAAFLMTAGGENDVTKVKVAAGLGWEKSEKVWFRAQTKYFMATTTFAQAAQGTLQAATDLGLTENEKNIIDCAWKAVGVVSGQCATITSTTPGTDPTDPASPTTPGTGTQPGDTGSDEGDTGSTDTGATTPSRRRTFSNDTGGCTVGSVGGSSTGWGAALALVALGLVVSRRRRA